MGGPRSSPARQAPSRPAPRRLCLAAAGLVLVALAVATRGAPKGCLWKLRLPQRPAAAGSAAADEAAAAVPPQPDATSNRGTQPPSIRPEEVPPGCLLLERAW